MYNRSAIDGGVDIIQAFADAGYFSFTSRSAVTFIEERAGISQVIRVAYPFGASQAADDCSHQTMLADRCLLDSPMAVSTVSSTHPSNK